LLDALVVARALNQINLTVNMFGPADLEDYLAAHAQRLREWLSSQRPAA
jgi:hypothetical protein